MGLFFLFVMIAVPIAEIAVFIEVGGILGLWPTLATVIVTAMAGTALLRHQGLATLLKAQESLARGRFPIDQVFDGLCLLFAGALLLTPGFITDAAGLVLFVPAARAWVRRLAGRYLAATGRVEMYGKATPGGGGGKNATVIEGEFHEVRPEDSPPEDRNGGAPPSRLN